MERAHVIGIIKQKETIGVTLERFSETEMKERSNDFVRIFSWKLPNCPENHSDHMARGEMCILDRENEKEWTLKSSSQI